MATIRHTLELQDRMTSQMERIQQSMAKAAIASEEAALKMNKMQTEYNSTAEKIASLEREIERASNLRMGTTDELIEKQISLVDKNTLLSESMQIQSERLAIARDKAESLSREYLSLQSAEESMRRGAEEYTASQDRITRQFDVQNETIERMTPTLDKQASVYQRYVGMVEMAAARAEGYRERLEALSESMRKNEADITLLSAAQEKAFSSTRQQEIDSLVTKQDQLNRQYQQTQNQLRSAEIAHVNAFNRMSQATMQLNPLVNGLSQGIGSIPGPLGQIGRVGVQALGQITAGAKAAQAGFIAMNAALTIGISLLVQAGVSAWNSYNQEQEAAAELAREWQDATERAARANISAIKGVASLTGAAKESWAGYISAIEKADKGVTQMQSNASMVQRMWNDLETMSDIENKTVEQLERMQTLAGYLDTMLPGLNIQMAVTGDILAAERERVKDLTQSYVDLSIAKAKSAAYVSKMQAAFDAQDEIQDRMSELNKSVPAAYQDYVSAQYDYYNMVQQQEAMSKRAPLTAAISYLGRGYTEEAKKYTEAESTYRSLYEEREQQQALYDSLEEDIKRWQSGFFDAMDKQRELEEHMASGGINIEELYRTSVQNISDLLSKHWDSDGDLGVKVNNKLSFKEEDIRMLHDIATRETRPIYQQITPQVLFDNVTIAETADVDMIASAIADMVTEAAGADLTLLH